MSPNYDHHVMYNYNYYDVTCMTLCKNFQLHVIIKKSIVIKHVANLLTVAGIRLWIKNLLQLCCFIVRSQLNHCL